MLSWRIDTALRKYFQILRYARDETRWLSLIVVITLVNAGMVVLTPWPLKLLIDYALGDATFDGTSLEFLESLSSVQLVILAAAAALTVTLLAALLENLMSWSWSVAGQRMVHRFAADVLNAMQRLSLRFHTKANVGDLINRVATDTYCVYQIIGSLLISPLQYLLTLLLIIAVSWSLSPVLTLTLIGVIPPLMLVAVYAGPKLKRVSRDQRDARSAMSSMVHQTLSAIPVVQMYNAEDRQQERFEGMAKTIVKTANRGVWQDHLFRLINGAATTSAIALVIYIGGVQVLEGTMTIGSLVVFLQYGRSISGIIRNMLNTYGKLSQSAAQLERVIEVLDSDEVVLEPDVPLPLPKNDGPGAHMEFSGVTFGYDPELPVLRDINLKIEAGSSVALVGQTGAGKTTLMSLVPRFFDPGQGVVRYNGVDVREVSLQSLRNRIAIILQQPFILPVSIRQNIAYGKSGASDEQVIEAAKQANAHGFIQKLPYGYDTILSEGGCDLSGGERQRIAIARAFLVGSEVLLMDEPTSALDGMSELVVIDALERLRKTRTTLIIAHRLSTTQNCDRILVMDEGRIVEQGSHDELIEQDGLYRKLFATQYEMTGGNR
jgi:ATP-binding cassette subfamily B protein/subfamily B ATP-binding cassette protein MsbA